MIIPLFRITFAHGTSPFTQEQLKTGRAGEPKGWNGHGGLKVACQQFLINIFMTTVVSRSHAIHFLSVEARKLIFLRALGYDFQSCFSYPSINIILRSFKSNFLFLSWWSHQSRFLIYGYIHPKRSKLRLLIYGHSGLKAAFKIHPGTSHSYQLQTFRVPLRSIYNCVTFASSSI